MKDLTTISPFAPSFSMRSVRSCPVIRRNAAVICTCTHFSARDMLLAAGPDLEENLVNSNLILPDALERQMYEGHGREVPSRRESLAWWEAYLRKMGRRATLRELSSTEGNEEEPTPSDAVYISVWTLEQNHQTLDFLVACTGRKPIFVFTSHHSSTLSLPFIERRMLPLAERMKKAIPERRVFAIVGIELVTQHLAHVWETLTDHSVRRPAYYEATHTFCTRKTLAVMGDPVDSGRCRVGLATKAHIVQAGKLCSAFTDSAHDDPYRLNIEQGIQEAAYLVARKELYVCEVLIPGTCAYEVVCIIAVTRKSAKVAAVSKVFTHENHRRQGYAKELLTHVCHEILRTRELVVLFVAHALETAARVYGRVGFVGVGDRPASERVLVERWLELGFEDVDIGHW